MPSGGYFETKLRYNDILIDMLLIRGLHGSILAVRHGASNVVNKNKIVSPFTQTDKVAGDYFILH